MFWTGYNTIDCAFFVTRYNMLYLFKSNAGQKGVTENDMKCPYCLHTDTKVTNKRDSGNLTRRRRECLKCNRRFSTHETVEWSVIKVIKKNGIQEPFSRDKIKVGIVKACEKRPVTENHIEKMINNIEDKVRKRKFPVKTEYIGELISKELKKIDKVAYIRFASVYRDFTDISDFKKEIRDLIKK